MATKKTTPSDVRRASGAANFMAGLSKNKSSTAKGDGAAALRRGKEARALSKKLKAGK